MDAIKLMGMVISILQSESSSRLPQVHEAIIEADIPAGCNVGVKGLMGTETARWWLGQIRSIIESEGIHKTFALREFAEWGAAHEMQVFNESLDESR